MQYESAGKGYIFVVIPGHPMADKRGRILLHRYLMSEAIGRLLKDDEVVHHRNKDPQDNRLENLELLGASAHVRLHHPPKTLDLNCPRCGKDFTRTQRQVRSALVFCSRHCSIGYYSAQRTKPIQHGATGYGRGCRCDVCKRAHADRIKAWRNGPRA